MRCAILVVVAACKGSAPAPVAPPPIVAHADAAVGGFPALAKADLVVALRTGELAAYTIANDRLAEVGRMAIIPSDETGGPPDTWLGASWIDRDHVLVTGPHLGVVTVAGLAPLAAPDLARFHDIAMPESPSMTHGEGHAIVFEHQVVWNQCVWGEAVDGFQCATYARLTLWPIDPAARVAIWTPPIQRVTSSGPAWTDARPAFAVTATGSALPTCIANGASITLAEPHGRGDHLYELHWLPSTPATLLVQYGEPGYADLIPESFAVFDRCTAKPLFGGTGFQLFVDGLWISEDTVREDGEDRITTTHLRRNLAVLGELPPSYSVVLRPK